MAKEELINKLRQAKEIIDNCLSELEGTQQIPSQKAIKEEKKTTRHLDFSIPMRPFMKNHSSKLSGPKKFTLLLAYLSKGELGKEIKLESVVKEWSKMSAIIGGKFNRFFSGTAKDNDWVETKKAGCVSFLGVKRSGRNMVLFEDTISQKRSYACEEYTAIPSGLGKAENGFEGQRPFGSRFDAEMGRRGSQSPGNGSFEYPNAQGTR